MLWLIWSTMLSMRENSQSSEQIFSWKAHDTEFTRLDWLKRSMMIWQTQASFIMETIEYIIFNCVLKQEKLNFESIYWFVHNVFFLYFSEYICNNWKLNIRAIRYQLLVYKKVKKLPVNDLLFVPFIQWLHIGCIIPEYFKNTKRLAFIPSFLKKKRKIKRWCQIVSVCFHVSTVFCFEETVLFSLLLNIYSSKIHCS